MSPVIHGRFHFHRHNSITKNKTEIWDKEVISRHLFSQLSINSSCQLMRHDTALCTHLSVVLPITRYCRLTASHYLFHYKYLLRRFLVYFRLCALVYKRQRLNNTFLTHYSKYISNYCIETLTPYFLPISFINYKSL